MGAGLSRAPHPVFGKSAAAVRDKGSVQFVEEIDYCL